MSRDRTRLERPQGVMDMEENKESKETKYFANRFIKLMGRQ